MSSATNPPHPADERILEYLAEHPPDYAPIVATHLGMHLRYVERRIAVLTDRGLLRAVTAEVVYTTTTTEGERRLREGTVRTSAESEG
jgi:DNA-binding Lrp family transcriptional regulator